MTARLLRPCLRTYVHPPILIPLDYFLRYLRAGLHMIGQSSLCTWRWKPIPQCAPDIPPSEYSKLNPRFIEIMSVVYEKKPRPGPYTRFRIVIVTTVQF